MTTASPKTILPPRLQRGACIGLAAPSGPIINDIAPGIRMLQEAGLETIIATDIKRQDNYLAGSDSRRLEELHELFANPEVHAIMAVRGGFGCSRLLPNLDYDLIRKNPKIIIGFSDLTILLNAIQQQTGLVTFHGPLLSTIIRDGRPALEACLNTLSSPLNTDIKIAGLEIIRSGQATGPFMGGNLTCLVSMLGTPHAPNYNGAIILLEDINESAYRIDRLLTQLKFSGLLDTVAGIILGDFLDNDLRPMSDIELIWQRVLDLTNKHIPVWANFPVGHGSRNITLPIGLKALMDSNNSSLTFSNGYGVSTP